jgi:hypothetical protein
VLRGEQDALAEQGQSGAAEHLSLDHLDVVDAALDRAGAPVHGQAVGDGVEVLLQALGEGGDAGQPGFAGSAKGIVRPPCPHCGRVIPLVKPRNGLRLYRNCVARSRAEPCSRCGTVREAATRDEDGRPLCPHCLITDPANQETCADCHRRRPVSIRTPAGPLCPSCRPWQVATCGICGREAPCVTSQATGEPWCGACKQRRARCPGCGRTGRVRGGTRAEPLCATCTRSDAGFWTSCPACGETGRIHAGRCARETGHFIRWAKQQKLTSLDFPATRWGGPSRVIDTGARWAQACRLLHDGSLYPEDRVAGLLVLLCAQWPSVISRLTLGHVHADGRQVQLSLGREPVTLPEPLASLVRQLLADRRGHAAIGDDGTSAWLFPAGSPDARSAPTAWPNASASTASTPARPAPPRCSSLPPTCPPPSWPACSASTSPSPPYLPDWCETG